MRMWDVNPALLCNKHLLGEHVEMHMFVGTIRKGISIEGYIEKGLLNPSKINQRHEELQLEMIKRGMNHQSPLFLDKELPKHEINKNKNEQELIKRCSFCKERILR